MLDDGITDGGNVTLTAEDIHMYHEMRDALGESNEFKGMLLQYDLKEYPILSLFQGNFVK